VVVQFDPIEGEALDTDFVASFVEAVYDGLRSADLAGYFFGCMCRVAEGLDTLPVTARERQRFNRMIERASDTEDALIAEAKKASDLTPVLLQAAAFDGSFQRMSRQWELASKHLGRIGVLWNRMASDAVVMARRAVSLAVYELAVTAHLRRSGGLEEEPSRAREAELDSLIDSAMRLLVTHESAIDRSDSVPTNTSRALVDALAGGSAHLRAIPVSSMTVHPADHPDRFVRVTSLADGGALVECVGDSQLAGPDRLTLRQKALLRTLQFEAPTRRRLEATWRRTMPESALLETPLLAAQLLAQVLEVTPGDKLRMTTRYIGDDPSFRHLWRQRPPKPV
jgi:hypothetical protein